MVAWVRRRALPLAAIVAAHFALSGPALGIMIVLGMTFGPQSPLSWPAYAVAWCWFFPHSLASAAGLPLGGLVDGGGVFLVNSLCWAVVVYPLWYVTRSGRRVAHRMLRRVPLPVWANVRAGLFGTAGAYLGFLGPVLTGGFRIIGGVAEVSFLDVTVAREVLSPGEAVLAGELRRWWFWYFPLLCGSLGGVVGVCVGFWGFRGRRVRAEPRAAADRGVDGG